MKTCNGGYCSYKLFGGSMPECSYEGYCDYQCPKDSRNNFFYEPPINPKCTCGKISIASCPIHGINGGTVNG